MDNQTVKERKRQRRKEIKALARELTPEYMQAADKAIIESLVSTEEYKAAKTVLYFLSMSNEPSTEALLELLSSAGKTAAIPLCVDTEGHIMLAKKYTGADSVKEGAYGILEPAEDAEDIAPEDIDLIVTPCVSCDRECRRLGHGAGYYDRYIPKTDCPVIALCYEALMSEEIPTDEYDTPMDAVITEAGIYRK